MMIIRPQYALGNEEPLPGARSFVLIVGGAIVGFVVLSKLFERGGKHNPEDAPAQVRCPLREYYGGLPSEGNYGHGTEYEIGAARIAEAAHCILGSLEKGWSRSRATYMSGQPLEDSMSVERAHIVEEMGIIDKCMREYAKPLYNERVLPKYIMDESWLKEEYRQSALMHSQKSIANIEKVSPKLGELAGRKMAALEACEGLPAYVLGLAHNSYQVVRQLSHQMQISVKRYPESVYNAFQSRALIADVSVLRGAVGRFLEATEGRWYAESGLGR